MNREDFPTLKDGLVYLDSAATSQTPTAVIEAVDKYYREYRASVHRGLYDEAEQATRAYEDARRKIADFIHASPEEIVFTKSATESLNMVAQRVGETLGEGDEVILTVMEHHSNLIPWQQMSKRYGFTIRWIPVKDDHALDMDVYRALLSEDTKVVAVMQASNVLGTVNPVGEIVRLAKEVGAITVIDAAQSIPHMEIDVRKMDCDFLAFSGHKMLGPTGIGVLYGKKQRLELMEPFLYGGGMIKTVSLDESTWEDAPSKFEAGTSNVAGVISLATAVDYLNDIGMDKIEAHGRELTDYAVGKLFGIDGLKIIGPRDHRIGVVSFTLDGMHPHDVSELLAREGVAVRGGHHCAMPLMRSLEIDGTTRASFHIYNTKEDVDQLIEAIKKAQEIFA